MGFQILMILFIWIYVFNDKMNSNSQGTYDKIKIVKSGYVI